MLKMGSRYTKTNPWKMYPRNLDCFCGSGKVSRDCPCRNLMPQWITAVDEKEAWKEMREMIAYVRVMRSRNIVFKDEERAKKFQRIFSERDGSHYNDREMEKKGDQVRIDKIDAKLEAEFKARRIDLDEQIIREDVNRSGMGTNGDIDSVNGERGVSDATNELSKSSTEDGTGNQA